MQFTEVLSRDEKKHLSRFATSFEQEYALSDEFQVVSLARTLELGGFRAMHVDPEAKPVAKAPAAAMNTIEPGAIGGIAQMFSRQRADDARRRAYDDAMRHAMEQMIYSSAMGLYGSTPAKEEKPLTDWNIPKLALSPVNRPAVTLASESGMYTLKSGDWSLGFKPSWHTAFPSRGRAGLNLYRSNYSAQLPPLPREAQKAVNDFGADKSMVLWEADWEQRDQYLDPAILVPVWRDLYSVVYTWDLTDAERNALKKASGN